VVIAARFEAERCELGGGEERCNVLIACGGAATVQFVVGEELHVSVDLAFERRKR
jgi:hypothetical protein